MNFFESQDRARRNTRRLLIYLLLAVVSIVVITNLLVMLVFGALSSDPESSLFSAGFTDFDWGMFGLVSAIVLAVIICGSLYKISALGSGGRVVAESLGGRLIQRETRDASERRALNVVEEMAIASGTPVPPVYLLAEESGINAFAAGHSPSDAVIGLTRGTINALDRDELQGVVAHEFSHIHNGDMRLNMRLIGILHGILLLGFIGEHLLRSGGRGRNSKNGAPIALLGLGLMVVGYSGIFFGNLIKASVSRQREFLADASAVQFTRDRQGIAGALKKIGGSSTGSLLRSENAAAMSHTYFSSGVTGLFQSMFATHPPLELRIKRIDPYWDGKFVPVPEPGRNDSREPPSGEQTDSRESGQDSDSTRRDQFAKGVTGVLVAGQILDSIGIVQSENLGYAREIIDSVPKSLRDLAHEPFGARALIYSLVLDTESGARGQQLQLLSAFGDPQVLRLTEQHLSSVRALEPSARLPLLDMAMPALKLLSLEQYQQFRNNLNGLILSDQKVSLFEWALQRNVLHHLDRSFGLRRPRPVRFGLKAALPHISVLLSQLAYSLYPDAGEAADAFNRAIQQSAIKDLKMKQKSELGMEQMGEALDLLETLKPTDKKTLLKICIALIGEQTLSDPARLEVLRAISAVLDCPIPPLQFAT